MFRTLRTALVTALAATMALSAFAVPALADDHGEVTRIKDIQPGAGMSEPAGFTAMGGKLYFVADDGVHGRELWVTDGTSAGTKLVKDILPGNADGVESAFLTVFDGRLYFAANDGEFGNELWRSDGTEAGTQRVTVIQPGNFSSNPSDLTVLGDTLYFAANDGLTGTELWRTDGTAQNTQRVADINPGAAHSFPQELTVFDGELYFAATEPVNGRELWRTDGTADGTALVKDVNIGAANGSPNNLTVFGGKLYFRGNMGDNGGRELWVVEPGGTSFLFVDINGGTSSEPRELTVAGNTLYFTAVTAAHGRELWASNGTAGGTNLVKDIRPGATGSEPVRLTAFGGNLYFTASDGSSGVELWRSNGTNAGTQQVADINAGPAGSSPDGLTAFGDRLMFSASDATGDRELWSSNGTAVGTRRVADINPTGDSDPGQLTVFGNRLVFVADDGTTGQELWSFTPSLEAPGDGGTPVLDCGGLNPAVFSDVEAGSTHGPAIGCLGATDIFTGYPDGTFDPTASITRAQISSVLFRAMNAAGADLAGIAPTFDDVTPGATHALAIGALAEAGIITGFGDGTFRPNVPVTRAQLTTMLLKAAIELDQPFPPGAATFDDVTPGSTHAPAIGALSTAQIVKGYPDNTFRPSQQVSRAQTATMLVNWLTTLTT